MLDFAKINQRVDLMEQNILSIRLSIQKIEALLDELVLLQTLKALPSPSPRKGRR